MSVLNLENLGLGPKATLFMYAHERERTEELGRFAYDAIRRSGARIVDPQALSTSLSRLALAYVSGVDVERMRKFNVEVLWLQDGVDLPEASRFLERGVPG